MNKIEIVGTDSSTNTKTLEIALEAFEISNAIINVEFISKEGIRDLNRKFRQIDKPTDVLSFPQIKIESAPIWLLGDIIICRDVVDEKDEDLEDVLKHGLLHLLGYDHETDEQKWAGAAKKIDCKY